MFCVHVGVYKKIKTDSKSTDTRWNKHRQTHEHNLHEFQPALFPSPRCFWSVSSSLNWCGVTDTQSFYLAWGKSQLDDSAIAGLWEPAHFLIHPSFMKWGIGEALFNNEINSSWGTLELSRFGGSILSCKHPSLLHPLLLIQLFFITFMKSKQCVIETDFYFLERRHGEYLEWHITYQFWNSKM